MFFDIITFLFLFTMFAVVWTIGFFVFDAEILNGYFKKKLQHRFNIDNLH